MGWFGSGRMGSLSMRLCWCRRCTRLPVGDTSDGWQFGILRQHFVLRLPDWLGLCLFVGADCHSFGRVRALIFAILCYSLFTFLGCIAQNVWQLGVFRFLPASVWGGVCRSRSIRSRNCPVDVGYPASVDSSCAKNIALVITGSVRVPELRGLRKSSTPDAPNRHHSASVPR